MPDDKATKAPDGLNTPNERTAVQRALDERITAKIMMDKRMLDEGTINERAPDRRTL